MDQDRQDRRRGEMHPQQKGRWNTTVVLLRIVFILALIYLWKLYQGE